MERDHTGFTSDAESTRPQLNWFRLLVYAGLLVFLSALLYREASLERPLISPPVLLVCLAGLSHILCGFTWRRTSLQRVLSWGRWVFLAFSVILSLRLMLPI